MFRRSFGRTRSRTRASMQSSCALTSIRRAPSKPSSHGSANPRSRRCGANGTAGAGAGTKTERISLLQRAAAVAAYVDVEVDLEPDAVPAGPRRIVSHHTLNGLPPDLDALFEQCLLRNADRVKIAATPADAVQAFRLLDLPTAGLGMGPWGGFTRALAPLTYCASEPVAPGLPTPADLFDLYDVRRIGPRTALYGVGRRPGRAFAIAAAAQSRAAPGWGRRRLPALPRGRPRAVLGGLRGARRARPVGDCAAEGASLPARVGAGRRRAGLRRRQHAAEGRACFQHGSAGDVGVDSARERERLDPRRQVGPRARLAWRCSGSGTARVCGRGRPEQAAALGVELAGQPESAPVVVNTTPLDPPAAPFVLDLRYGAGVDPPRAGGRRPDVLARPGPASVSFVHGAGTLIQTPIALRDRARACARVRPTCPRPGRSGHGLVERSRTRTRARVEIGLRP